MKLGITCHVPKSVGKCEGMNSHTPKWVPTLGVGVPMDSKFLECDYKGLNPLHWNIPYIIGKLLEPKCLKWANMTHLGFWNISYGQKKGQKSIHMCIGWRHGKVYSSITLAVYISSSQEIRPKPIINLLYI